MDQGEARVPINSHENSSYSVEAAGSCINEELGGGTPLGSEVCVRFVGSWLTRSDRREPPSQTSQNRAGLAVTLRLGNKQPDFGFLSHRSKRSGNKDILGGLSGKRYSRDRLCFFAT